MAIRASTNSKFLLKYLIIGLAAAGYGLYGAYDAFIGYPANIPASEAWGDLQSDETLNDGQRDRQYKEIAKEKGWPSKHPSKTVAAIEHDIIYNYVIMVIGLGVGVPCLIWYFKNRGTWIELDGETIRSSRGQEFKIESITEFDKKRWEKKGIGVIAYNSGSGLKSFIVDDLKFAREETDEIVRLMESRISPAMIVNGPPEVATESNREIESDSLPDSEV